MDPRAKSSVLWGLVGGLAFLVLLQGYELFAGTPVDLGVKFGVAALVAAGSTVLSYLVQPRVIGNESP